MSQTTPSAAGPLTSLVASRTTWLDLRRAMPAFCMVQTHLADTSKHMKGIHHESKQALARRETPRSGSLTR